MAKFATKTIKSKKKKAKSLKNMQYYYENTA